MASEHALQVVVARMLHIVLDPQRVWWTAIDHGIGRLSRRAAGMMKARGVRAGIPDFLFLPKGRPALGIELKTDKGRLSPAQAETALNWAAMETQGVYVARSLEEVQAVLEHCRIPMRSRIVTVGDGHVRPGRAARPGHQRTRRRGRPKGALPLVL